MKKTKALIGLFLAAVMLFSAVVPALAAGDKCSCGNTPVISITGIAHVPLVNGNGEQVFAPSATSIISAVLPVIPSLITYLQDGDAGALIDSVAPVVKELFDPIKCDANGNSVDPDVHIDRFFPESADNYDYYIKEDEQDKLSMALADEVGADHVFVFTYDWRLSMSEVAAQLDDYIQNVKEKTGHSKVSINGQSLGTCVVQTYLAKYGYGDVKNVAMFSGAYTGVEMVGQLFTGNIQIDPDGLVDIIVQAINGSPDSTALGEFLKYTSLFESVLEKLAPVINDYKDRIYNELLIPYFGYIPSLWSLVPASYLTDAYNYMFKTVKPGAELTSKIMDYYLTVQLTAKPRIQYLIDSDDYNYFCVSNYNRQIAPVTPSGNMQSDGVIETAHTSAYATVANRGSVLADSYVQAVNCHENHISPDRIVDASTCWAPENTWFIKNMDHVKYTEGNSGLFVWLMTADEQYDVRSNPYYPQFMQYNVSADNLAPYLYEYGDVNMDGVINLVDARLALRHCMDRAYLEGLSLVHADRNADNVVSKSEVTSIVVTYATA